MKKIANIIYKVIFFIPAIWVTFIIMVLYSPTLSVDKWIILAILWGSGFILSLNKVWGSCLGIALAIILLVVEESLWMPISLTPYLIAIIIYYAMCSFIVFRLRLC